MIDITELDKALEAHVAWKERFNEAVERGTLDMPIATVGADNQCAFGKWLYGPSVTAEDRQSPQYGQVKQLHAEFHKVAAKIAALATSGKKAEAQKLLKFGDEYTQISGKLSLALKRWKESIQLVPVR